MPQLKPTYAGLSSLTLFAIVLAQFHEAMQVTLPYTVAVFFVRRFASGPDDGEEHVGRLTGLLAAAFTFAQFLTSFLWGRTGDSFGRKPLVVMSNVSSMMTVLVFGLTRSYLVAFGVRLAGGLFNCTFLCVKSMIGEALTPEAQARPMAYLSLAWGLGTIAGPSLGGLLSFPCDKLDHMPLCGPDQLLRVRPFFLPCAATACVSLAAALSSICLLRETNPRIVRQGYHRAAGDDLPDRPGHPSLELTTSQPTKSPINPEDQQAILEAIEEDHLQAGHPSAPDAPSHSADDKLPVQHSADEEGEPQGETRGWLVRGDSAQTLHHTARAGKLQRLLRSFSRNRTASDESSSSVPPSATVSQHEDDVEADAENGFEDAGLLQHQHKSNSSQTASDASQKKGSSSGASARPADQREVFREAESASGQAAAESDESPDRPWWKDRHTLITVAGYGSIAFTYNLVDEMVPIYASAPVDSGGLGLTTTQLAVPLGLGGIAIILWSLFVYARLRKLLGTKNTCRVGLLGSTVCVLLLAVPSEVMPRKPYVSMGLLSVAIFLEDICANNTFTSSMIMVNSAAPHHAMGAVNGFGQSLACFVRAAGPALGGIAWGVSTTIPIHGHQWLPFACVAVLMFCAQMLYRQLPQGFAG